MEISVDAYIRTIYTVVAQRIDAYKKIAGIETDEDLADIRDELEDRYGKAPKPVENLFYDLAAAFGGFVASLHQNNARAAETSLFTPKNRGGCMVGVAAEYKGRVLMNVSQKPYISVRIKKGDDPLVLLYEIFKKYIQISSENV